MPIWIQDITHNPDYLLRANEIVSATYQNFQKVEVPISKEWRRNADVVLAALKITSLEEDVHMLATVSLNFGAKDGNGLEFMELFEPSIGDWCTYSSHEFNPENITEVAKFAFIQSLLDQSKSSRQIREEIAFRFFNAASLIGKARFHEQIWAVASMPVARLLTQACQMEFVRVNDVELNEQNPIMESFPAFWKRQRPRLYRAYSEINSSRLSVPPEQTVFRNEEAHSGN